MWASTVPHCLSGDADTVRDPHIHWQPAWAQLPRAGSVIWAEFMWLAWTDNTQLLQFSARPRPFTVALMQKRQIGIKSNAFQPHSSFWSPGIHLTFPIVHPWLYMFVGSRLWLRQLAGQLQRRRCQLCLGCASLRICLMPRPAKSPTSGFHSTLPA